MKFNIIFVFIANWSTDWPFKQLVVPAGLLKNVSIYFAAG